MGIDCHHAKMNQQLSLSRFSEPQVVFVLLGWLRLLTSILLLAFYGIVEFLGIDALQPMLQWPMIAVFGGANILLSFCTFLLKKQEITKKHIGIVLFMDIIFWYGLIAASGGAINPAISYLLVLLSISALSLEIRQSVVLAMITVILYAVMMNAQPEVHHGHMLNWHLWGMWVLFLMNALIMLVVITLLMTTIRDKDRAIAAYREETVRNEQLVSMGTLAANIAHELGTPLSTIAILVDDIDHQDVKIIKQQLERCKQALGQLKSSSAGFGEQKTVSSTLLIQRLVHELVLLKPEANISWKDEVQSNLLVTPLLEQALLALLNNAVEAAHCGVTIVLHGVDRNLVVDINHDGERVSEELLKTLGQKMVDSNKNSLGIGYYLANASIERLGGRLQIGNYDEGVLTRIIFPRERLLAKNE